MRPAASRGSQGAEAARRCPASSSGSSIPAPIDRLAARLPQGSALVSATNGKTTTAAMAAEILAPRVRLAHNGSGANLVSGVASTLLAAERRRARPVRGRRGARCPRSRAGVRAAGGLPRQPLPRPARPLRRARARSPSAGVTAVARAAARRRARRQRATIRSLGELARGARRALLTFGLDDPRHARPSLQHAADSKYCVACGTPYDYAAAYVGHLGDYRCPHVRARTAAARRRCARDRAARARRASSFDLVTPEGTRARRARAARALQRLQRARRRGARHARSGVPLDEIAARARALRRRVRPLRADRGRRPATC